MITVVSLLALLATFSIPAGTATPTERTATMDDVTELRPRVVESIRTLLPQVLGRDVPPPAESACLFDEVGLTSSTTLSLLLELEDDLDIQIDVEEINQDDLASLGTLADFVTAHAVAEL